MNFFDSQNLSDEKTSSCLCSENACRRWSERTAVSDACFQIKPGSVVALLGPSGSGKSTIIGMLAGTIKPSSGRILHFGHNIGAYSPSQLRNYRKNCGIIQQNHLLVPQLSVHQNVMAGRAAKMPWHRVCVGALWPIERSEVHQLLCSLDIGDYQWEVTGNLSGGQMQRVTIARALIGAPNILFADEPTASLDPVTAKAVTALILEQARLRKVTLVFSTHWVDLVLSACDHVIGVRNGSIVLNAHPQNVTKEDLEDLYDGTDERI